MDWIARGWMMACALTAAGCITPWDDEATRLAAEAGVVLPGADDTTSSADATATGSSALKQWLRDEGLGFGFEVVPGGYTPEPIDCDLDPRVFGEDPHARLLDRGFYAGIGGRPSAGFQSFWDETFAPDWGVDASYAVGGKILSPDDELVTDVGWVANRTDDAGQVRDEWMPPSDMIADRSLATAWYHMEFAGIFHLETPTSNAYGFLPRGMFLFADFAMVEGRVQDVLFASSTAPAAFHMLLWDGTDYCDVVYVLDRDAFGYAQD